MSGHASLPLCLYLSIFSLPASPSPSSMRVSCLPITHTHTHTCTHACTHARMRACTHACTHTRTHANTHAHHALRIHIQKPSLYLPLSLPLSPSLPPSLALSISLALSLALSRSLSLSLALSRSLSLALSLALSLSRALCSLSHTTTGVTDVRPRLASVSTRPYHFPTHCTCLTLFASPHSEGIIYACAYKFVDVYRHAHTQHTHE